MITLQEIEEIATKAHEGQFRRDGVTPYIDHPRDVVSRCESSLEKMTAWLHDVLEDTEHTLIDLAYLGVPREVTEAVLLLTKTKGQSYSTYLMGIKENSIARKVKIADMISNLSDTPTQRQIAKYAKGMHFLTT